jgi:hypothetical protein
MCKRQIRNWGNRLPASGSKENGAEKRGMGSMAYSMKSRLETACKLCVAGLVPCTTLMRRGNRSGKNEAIHPLRSRCIAA